MRAPASDRGRVAAAEPPYTARVSRLSEPQDPDFQRLNSSIAFDRRLWPQDLAQSRAHARMLAARGIIAEEDLGRLLEGLEAVEGELSGGDFPFAPDDEDIHMAIERRLTEIVGPVGGRLHTARSRNDQVVTDLMLYTRERAAAAVERIGWLMGTLLERAEEHADCGDARLHPPAAGPAGVPGAPPAGVLLDVRPRPRAVRLRRAPVRTAAARVRRAGGRQLRHRPPPGGRRARLRDVAENSLDAVSGRDFALDYLGAAATCATHLSRLGAELVLWSSSEFGFLELSDSWSSSSSLMPQKKNPDAAELLRAKAPRVVAHLSALHGVIHALPLAYNKDLQEDKEHLFDTSDTLELCLAAARGMLADARFDREAMSSASADELVAATDVADLLVRLGTPFREAHGIVAGLVRGALEAGKPISELDEQELAVHSRLLADHRERAAGRARPRVRRWSRRSPREVPRPCACANSSRSPAPSLERTPAR